MGDKDRKFNLAERFIIQMTSGAGAGARYPDVIIRNKKF